jgi:predicted transcriptional regulator
MDSMKVKGHDNLIRDPKTNAIVNTNMSEYEEYLSRRDSKNKENQKIQNLERDLDSIKGDIEEIKFLLRNITNGSK